MLKPELIRAIGEAGFENPSEGILQLSKKKKNFIFIFLKRFYYFRNFLNIHYNFLNVKY